MHDVARAGTMRPQLEAKRKSSRRPVLAAVLGLLAIFFVLAGIKALQIKKMTSGDFQLPPTTVTSATVKQETWASILSAVGSISAVQGAVVSTELGGTVSEIKLQHGGDAKKGDVLLKLDTSAEEALLRSSEAEAELAQADVERTRDLARKKVVSQSELDAAESKWRRLTAVVDQMRSNIHKKTI